LKAPLNPEQLSEFEGAEHAPGTFQIAMVLLALTIGFPTESRQLFDQLWREATSGGEPADLMRAADSDENESTVPQPLMKIRQILSSDAFPRDREAYEFWLPRVSRFSFDLTPMIEEGGYAAVG
jgi:hypothetical protein